jgi:transposase
MKHYVGIDLHCNNNYLVIIDEGDRIVFEERMANDLEAVERALQRIEGSIEGIAVESTFNWYWLVDGLKERGYRMHLVNTSAVKQYEGLKHRDDDFDAFWLAHLLRLGILPTGHIYPKEGRAVRDLLRKRRQLVRHRTAHLLSVQNLFARNRGWRLSGGEISRQGWALTEELENEDLQWAICSSLRMIQQLEQETQEIERRVLKRLKGERGFGFLQTVSGVGPILALTIWLETGDIGRFARVGQYASYCRCVRSQRRSNQKSKGTGNRKNGNKYLKWAYSEAAHFAYRFDVKARRFYQRKKARTNPLSAWNALAHKLCRASYFVMRDQVAFSSARLFG